jgi:hypothetical protein
MGWSTCNFNVNGGGKVTAGSCNDSSGASVPVTDGQLDVTSGCNVRGYMNIGGTLNTVPVSRLSLDRSTISGVVEVYGETTTFTAMRK